MENSSVQYYSTVNRYTVSLEFEHYSSNISTAAYSESFQTATGIHILYQVHTESSSQSTMTVDYSITLVYSTVPESYGFIQSNKV